MSARRLALIGGAGLAVWWVLRRYRPDDPEQSPAGPTGYPGGEGPTLGA